MTTSPTRSAATVLTIALGLISGLFAAPARAATYYVSTMGDDGAPGTQTLPWRTIQKAAESLKPGDTAVVMAGTYREQVFVESQGLPDRPVTLRAEGKVIVSAKGMKKGRHVFYLENKSHVRIQGFEIRDLETNDGSGIRFEGAGTDLEFRDNVIHEMRGENATGIVVYAYDPMKSVSRLVIAGNTVHHCDAAPSEAIAVNGNVEDFLIEHNHVHDINGIGIDMIGGEEGFGSRDKVARRGVCRGNRVERARSNYEGGYGAGIYVDGGRDILIERNLVTECDLGIEVGAENAGIISSGIVVRNNVVHDNDKAGFVIGGYNKDVGRVQDCVIEHNHFLRNTPHAKAEAEIWIQFAADNQFRANLIAGTGTRPLLYQESRLSNTLENNLWHAPKTRDELFTWQRRVSADWDGFRQVSGQEKTGLWADPRLAADGWHLSADSPARDAALPVEGKNASEAKAEDGPALDYDGEARQHGTARDIGADEHHETPPP